MFIYSTGTATVRGSNTESEDGYTITIDVDITLTEGWNIITQKVTLSGTTGTVTVASKNPGSSGVWVYERETPTLDGSVYITGNTTGTMVGDTLTADTSSLNGIGTISYQWQRDFSNISGATSSTYTVTAADGGHFIGVQVSRAGYIGTVSSSNTASVGVPVGGGAGTTSVVAGTWRGKLFYSN
jgi:hypothetical protein